MRAACLLTLCALLAGCVSRNEMAGRLATAMTPTALPTLSACWESSFERAGFRGRYIAVTDFVVASDGRLSQIAVRELLDDSGPEPTEAYEAGDLRRCIETGLEGQTVAFEASHALTVTGYRIAFRDGNEEARLSRERLLIGPRHDRCKGLYGYDPPRDLAVIQGELDRASETASRTQDRDALARALQHGYDLALELGQRLEIERRADLPPESEARIERERDRVRKIAREVGERIGCRPPD